MQLEVQSGDERIVLTVEADGEGWRVRLPDGIERRITASRLPGDVLQIVETDGNSSQVRTFRVPFAPTADDVAFSFMGQAYTFAPPQAPSRKGRGTSSGTLSAPMVGVVAEVLVREGQAVEAYQPLVVIEAMKVMATIEAPFAGTVKAIHVSKGRQVQHGEQVVEISPLQADTEPQENEPPRRQGAKR